MTFICKTNLPQRLSANSANSLYQAARADQQVAESRISQLEAEFPSRQIQFSCRRVYTSRARRVWMQKNFVFCSQSQAGEFAYEKSHT
jgi:hypothetical protein